MNVDVESHPVGCITPQILIFCLSFQSKFCIYFSEIRGSIKKKKTKHKLFDFKLFFALKWTILWCGRTHRVSFYVCIHVYVCVSNLRNVPFDATRFTVCEELRRIVVPWSNYLRGSKTNLQLLFQTKTQEDALSLSLKSHDREKRKNCCSQNPSRMPTTCPAVTREPDCGRKPLREAPLCMPCTVLGHLKSKVACPCWSASAFLCQ